MSYQQYKTSRGGTIGCENGVIIHAWLSPTMSYPLKDEEKGMHVKQLSSIIDNYIATHKCRCTRCCKDMELTDIAQREAFSGVVCEDCVPSMRAELISGRDDNCYLCQSSRSLCSC